MNKIIRKHPPALSLPPGWNARLGTLSGEVVIKGRGLHTGRKATVRILPASPEQQRQGIIFRRTGAKPGELKVSPELWRNQPLCSTLCSAEGLSVRTVEHLLAALLMAEIDAATVELDAEEVPILEGAAGRWLAAIAARGRVDLPGAKRFIRVIRPLVIYHNRTARHSISPHRDYLLAATARTRDFPSSSWRGTLQPESFASELASARSYGRVSMALPAILGGYIMGTPILRGAPFAPLAMIFNKRVLGGTRFPNEFARHKALDLIGDFAMAGAPLLAKITAVRPNHLRNAVAIKTLMNTKDAWTWVEFNDNNTLAAEFPADATG